MIIGECPHCEKVVTRTLPDVPLPVLGREHCPECDNQVWVYYSRVDPAVYTDEEAAEVFQINHDTKQVTVK